ncbi:hypothetical protein DRQ36_07435 [bacterium]|nr:MAG: hypothetical protein DRQ36_07435 [bacterium]
MTIATEQKRVVTLVTVGGYDTSVIAGGGNNDIHQSTSSFIGGGIDNKIDGSPRATIGGGYADSIIAVGGEDSNHSGIVGGEDNKIKGSEYSFIGGGEGNIDSLADHSFIGGGEKNFIHSCHHSAIPGGNDVEVSGDYSFAFGNGVTVTADNIAAFFNSGGKVGINAPSPTACLDVNGANGYDQVRMRTSFTPANSADANGNTGDIAWDVNYIYIKTGAGWRRARLAAF